MNFQMEFEEKIICGSVYSSPHKVLHILIYNICVYFPLIRVWHNNTMVPYTNLRAISNNMANLAIMGFSMSSDEFSNFHDIYEDFDIIGPYFTILSTMEAKFLHGIVVRTVCDPP